MNSLASGPEDHEVLEKPFLKPIDEEHPRDCNCHYYGERYIPRFGDMEETGNQEWDPLRE
jgi:hypothetical protein